MSILNSKVSAFLNTPVFMKDNAIGLDFGSHSLKFAVVNEGGKAIEYLWKAVILPERTTKDQELEIGETRRRLIALVRAYQSTYFKFNSGVNSVVQGENTVAKYLEIPKVSKDEIELAVHSKAIKHIPFPLEDVNIDYVVVPPLFPEKDKKGIFVVAAQKKAIDDLKKFLVECGLKAKRVEVPIMPIVREFSTNHKLEDDRYYAIVHTGFKLTHVVIMRNGYPYYSRDFSIAGRDFTYAFQMASQSSWQDAEEYKMEYDVMRREFAVEPYLLRWIREIEKSIDYFKAQLPDGTFELEKIYLSGGSAGWKNLDKFLAQSMNIDVQIDQWDRFRINRKNDNSPGGAELYKIAVGLTLNK